MRLIARPALAAAAVVSALALTLSACNEGGGGDDNADAKPSASDKADKKEVGGIELPDDLPTSLEDLDKWRDGGWKKWDKDEWLREAQQFINPIIEDLWDPDRMRDAETPDKNVPEDVSDDQGQTDPAPQPVPARQAKTPYTNSTPGVGKIFFDSPQGPMVCSGTVIEDPKNPGKSNLVATAGHCVHAGQKGGWFRNVAFVPSYNPQGKSAAELRADRPTEQELAPQGQWWAEKARTTDQWISQGRTEGGFGAPYDFAVLKVKPKDGRSKSLQETTGAAVPVWWNAPKVAEVGNATAMGYPAAKPYDGQRVYSCADGPGRLSIQADQPTMYRIGCTMTAGASGGGWFAENGGKRSLVSVTSIGPLNHEWLAGPRLGPETKKVFDTISGG
ncbi:trypsin-like serine peptidase [Streptomyces boninensis]|uniref:trypsin-like serine peptidase n=1 Tax=Streptomyces boninensis TaxID=2039455 RepID=UPI003B21DD08